MSRRHRAEKREILPDPKFGSQDVTKFINCLMVDGKKSVAEKALYEALEMIEKEIKADPLEVFNEALENVKPNIEVKSRRVGGATYQVPMEVRAERKLALAIRWLIQSAKKRKEKMISIKIAKELMDAAKKMGEAIKKRQDTHKMAAANKAFSHFRW